MKDRRLTLLAMISIERACVRDLDLYNIVNVFSAKKAGRKTF